ncbi:unnamed protein product [Pleuronectes platessa]|uniref:Uncharacterized protein n=1 Tax=Pleuronectes platessa TaxID=8262 RepID=A0A9N7VUH5_PLEPL|nr:unnamed protein product [Pleuronectes platessa]
MFVVKPLGTCRGWGSSRSVALLSAPPEAQCAAPGGPHPVAPHGVAGAGAFFLLDRGAVSIAGTEGGLLEGIGYGGRRRPLWTRVGPFSRITSAKGQCMLLRFDGHGQIGPPSPMAPRRAFRAALIFLTTRRNGGEPKDSPWL